MTASVVVDRIHARVRRHQALPSLDERRRLREEAGLSQQEFADAMGVSQSALAGWESEANPRNPRGPFLDLYVEGLQALRALLAGQEPSA